MIGASNLFMVPRPRGKIKSSPTSSAVALLGTQRKDEALYGVRYDEDGAQTIKTERGAYQAYFVGVADAIRLGTDNPVPAVQAVQNIALIEMALESSKAGKTIQVKSQLKKSF